MLKPPRCSNTRHVPVMIPTAELVVHSRSCYVWRGLYLIRSVVNSYRMPLTYSKLCWWQPRHEFIPQAVTLFLETSDGVIPQFIVQSFSLGRKKCHASRCEEHDLFKQWLNSHQVGQFADLYMYVDTVQRHRENQGSHDRWGQSMAGHKWGGRAKRIMWKSGRIACE